MMVTTYVLNSSAKSLVGVFNEIEQSWFCAFTYG